MNINIFKISLTLILIIFIGISCKKGPGVGGKTTVSGLVWVKDYNSTFTYLNGQYAGADVDVYLICGDDLSYSEKTKANYNGYYEFKYLRPGKYTLYTYSKDSTRQSPSGDVAVVKQIELSKKDKTFEVEKMLIFD